MPGLSLTDCRSPTAHDVVVEGTPNDVDAFLTRLLWGRNAAIVDPVVVLAWSKLLRNRGDAFASYVDACEDWVQMRFATRERPASADEHDPQAPI